MLIHGDTQKAFESLMCIMRKAPMGFPKRSGTNQSVLLQKMARSLKFWIQKEIVLSV